MQRSRPEACWSAESCFRVDRARRRLYRIDDRDESGIERGERNRTLTERYNESAVFLEAESPAASEQTDVQLARWDLPSLGKESLAPGESLKLVTTYAAASSSSCDLIRTGAVVEATVGGATQRYGARADDVAGGTCAGEDTGDTVPGGSGPAHDSPMGLVPPSGGSAEPVMAPSTGDGAAPGDSDARWAVAGLAAAGVALVVAARLIRKRA